MTAYYSSLIPRAWLAPALLATSLSILSGPVSAVTFPIDMKSKMKDIKVIAITRTIDIGSTVIVELSNLDDKTARCRVTFDPGIVQKKAYKRTIKPGATNQVRFAPGRQVNRMKIEVLCKPGKPKTSS